ncbi:MAG: ribonuclease III [Vicingaceae bacterium]
MSLFRGLRYFLLPDNSKSRTLKSILGFYPKNIALYEQAFTHKSVVNETEKEVISNERLEFLGDAILGAIIADYFFNRFPFEEEGFLTKVRSKLVSRSFLNQLSIDVGLDTFLETSADLNRSKSIYGDAFEAFIGAIYIDMGYIACKKFVVEKIISDYIDVEKLIKKEIDFKSKLVEWCQKHRKVHDYKLIEKRNKEHKYYHCILEVNGKEVAEGEAQSKKKAEQAAAKQYFEEKIAEV